MVLAIRSTVVVTLTVVVTITTVVSCIDEVVVRGVVSRGVVAFVGSWSLFVMLPVASNPPAGVPFAISWTEILVFDIRKTYLELPQ